MQINEPMEYSVYLKTLTMVPVTLTRPRGLMLTCEKFIFYLTYSENLNHFVSHF